MNIQWVESSAQQIGQSNCEIIQQQDTEKLYCRKRFQKNRLTKNRIQKMIDVCKKLMLEKHENIIQIIDIHETQTYVYVYMDYCESDLAQEFNRNKNYSEIEIINIIQQLLKGFKSLYKLNIQHRNIQPKKILIKRNGEQNKYLITDFFQSKEVEDMQLADEMTQCGIKEYQAPELMFQLPASGKCDIYSLGIIFYQLCFQCKLPYMYNDDTQVEKIVRQLEQAPFKAEEMFYKDSQILKDLLDRMIVYDTQRRIDFEELFSHPINKMNQNEYEEIFSYLQILLAKYEICESISNKIKNLQQNWNNLILLQSVYLVGKSYLTQAKAIFDYEFDDIDQKFINIFKIQNINKLAYKIYQNVTNDQQKFIDKIQRKYQQLIENMNQLRVKIQQMITDKEQNDDYEEFFFQPSFLLQTFDQQLNRLKEVVNQMSNQIQLNGLQTNIEKIMNLEQEYPAENYKNIQIDNII